MVKYLKYLQGRKIMNEQIIKNIFNETVLNINTIRPNYKATLIPELKCIFGRFMNNMIINGIILQYVIEIERIGQRNIVCMLSYKENYFSPIENIKLESKLRTPKEARKLLFDTFADAVILAKYEGQIVKPIITYDLK